MREITEQQVLTGERYEQNDCAIFLYTPMCGTCIAARKMLDVLLAMDEQLNLYSCNMNTAARLAEQWKIESVPCIVVIKDGMIAEKIYAVRSVPALYERFVAHGLMALKSK